jgi:hypothetical protein
VEFGEFRGGRFDDGAVVGEEVARALACGLGGDARVLAEGLFEDVDDAAVVEIASGQLAGGLPLVG